MRIFYLFYIALIPIFIAGIYTLWFNPRDVYGITLNYWIAVLISLASVFIFNTLTIEILRGFKIKPNSH